ncbi:Re/Si-specific NAD(P)(+) transhydrogenase subunit alpha [Rhodoligotrophos ferricapiens]|uniref:Re/Si-specific NAD(P)(+) transhydrogenase subunit alpha n=1 Tax=Rhodoligotrophos ferricapiens TaxID=3069264 RepID=UPI00315DA36E
MKLLVLAEQTPGEARVSAVPDTVKALVKKGLEVAVVRGAGQGSNLSDDAYQTAGATLADNAVEAAREADIVLSVRRPSPDVIAALKPGAVVVGQLDPYGPRDEIDNLAKGKAVAFAMELMPRITRAQSMDVLSSQANLAGYKAVIDAAAAFGRALPMMMTAAGTVPAARAFVMGVGVAGLQAIATARRLGAVVTATDVRRAAAEQVQSLGAKFIMVDAEGEDLETKGGYAKEMSEDYQRRQAALVAEHIKSQDIVITTALIPGRPAPRLITAAMVESMKPGSVIVDLAAERGGNIELTKPGEAVTHNGVTILGHLNLAARLAGNASPLYAKNLTNFLEVILKDGALAIDWEDEIIKGTALTRDGEIVHPALKN